MTERWRDIPGFEGRYQASDLGRVRSVDRYVRSRGGQRRVRGIVLKPQRHSAGYLHVGIDGRVKIIGPLVLAAFVGKRPDGTECAHGNGDKHFNALGNLRWATPAENAHDRRTHGTSGPGEANAQAKLTEARVAAIRTDPRRQRDIAADHGVSQPTVSKIKRGQRWATV